MADERLHSLLSAGVLLVLQSESALPGENVSEWRVKMYGARGADRGREEEGEDRREGSN